jgi:hypothetical protein
LCGGQESLMFRAVKRAIFILLALLGCAGGSVPQTAGNAAIVAAGCGQRRR